MLFPSITNSFFIMLPFLKRNLACLRQAACLGKLYTCGKLYAFGKPQRTSFTPTPEGISVNELLRNFLRKMGFTLFKLEHGLSPKAGGVPQRIVYLSKIVTLFYTEPCEYFVFFREEKALTLSARNIREVTPDYVRSN